MPAVLLTFVEGLLGPRFAKFAQPLIYVVLGLLLVGAFFGLKSCYDHGVVNKHEQKMENRAKPATDRAASERATDTINNARNEEEVHNAIAAQPDQSISPTSHALACERLRRVGHHPASCR